MPDDQIKLLTEIRDIAREHMELYRERSARAINTQRRAIQIWLAFVATLIGLVVLGALMINWLGSEIEIQPRPPAVYGPPQIYAAPESTQQPQPEPLARPIYVPPNSD